MKKEVVIAVVVSLVLGGGGGYYVGTKVASGSTSVFGANGQGDRAQARMMGQAGMRGSRQGAGGGFTVGEVVSKDAQTLTVKLADGSSKIVFYSETTPVMKTASGTPADVITGETITISGTANADGSITAQSIQLRPNGFVRTPNVSGGMTN